MAGKRLRQNGTWEYVFKRKGVLDGPIYFTFDTEEEGDCYAAKAESLLTQGIVPPEMLEGSLKTLGDLCALYGATVTMADSEAELLPTLQKLTESVRIERLSYAWAETLVSDLKAAGRAPSTISKRISGLARVVDWGMRRKLVTLEANPLRLLPRGYSVDKIDKNKLWDGERDRRRRSISPPVWSYGRSVSDQRIHGSTSKIPCWQRLGELNGHLAVTQDFSLPVDWREVDGEPWNRAAEGVLNLIPERAS